MTLEHLFILTQKITNGNIDLATVRELDILLESSFSLPSSTSNIGGGSINLSSNKNLENISSSLPKEILNDYSYKPWLLNHLLSLDTIFDHLLLGSYKISHECLLIAIRVFNRIMPKWRVHSHIETFNESKNSHIESFNESKDSQKNVNKMKDISYLGYSALDIALQKYLVGYLTGTIDIQNIFTENDTLMIVDEEMEDTNHSNIKRINKTHASHVLKKLWETKHSKIQIFVLEQIARIPLIGYFDQWDEMDEIKIYLNMILDAFQHDEISVTKVAVDLILHTFCLKDDFIYGHWLFSSLIHFDEMNDSNAEFQLIEKIKNNSKSNIILYLRYLEFIVALSSKSEYYFVLCQKSGLLDELISNLTSTGEDILAMLNVLELVQKIILIPSPSAIEFIVSSKVFEIISTQLFETYAGDALLEDYLISAIGQMTNIIGNHLNTLVPIRNTNDINHTEDLNRKKFIDALSVLLSPNIFLKICDEVDNSRKNVELISLRVVSCILATSPKCLSTFLEDDTSIIKLREKYFEHLYLTHSSDAHEVYLNGVSQVISSHLVPLEYIKQFFDEIIKFHNSYKKTRFTQEILETLKSPFSEIRLGTFQLIESFCLHPFSAQILLESNLFINEMLNRKTETDRSCMEKKWSALNTLSITMHTHPEIRLLISNLEFIDIRTYVHRGPFYNDEAQVLVLDKPA